MAEDKSFRELIKEVKELNKSITQQKEELVDAQNRTTEMVTRRLTKAQTEQLDKDNEQIKIAEEQKRAQEQEADRQADADKKAQELENKKFTMQKFNDRVANKLKKAPSALLGAARVATYNNKIMRGIGGTLKGLNKSFGIGSTIKAGGKTLFSIIKNLVRGGLIIGGIILLDKFFNSEMWPKTIEFIEKKLIPGIKKFFKFMRDKFGPLVTRLLFGKGGTFEQPTGGLYGAVKSVSSWIATTSKDIADFMKKDDTGSKFKNMIKSFVSLVGSIFGMGREKDLSKAKYGEYNKSYFDNIKDAAKKFKDDFVIFFESLAASFASGLFGYENEEESFFKGLRDDLSLMFKKIVQGIGEAFYQTYPKIANLFGIKSAAENKVLAMEDSKQNFQGRESNSPLSYLMFDTVDEGGGAGLRALFEDANEQDKAFMKEYAEALNEFERQRIDNQGLIPYIPDASANAIIAAILGEEAFRDGFGGYDQRAGKTANDVKVFLKKFFSGASNADNIEKLGGKNAEKRKTQEAIQKYLEDKENQLMILQKRNGGVGEIEALKNEIIKLKEVLENSGVGNGATIIDGSSNTTIENKDMRTSQPLAGNANGFLFNLSKAIYIYI